MSDKAHRKSFKVTIEQTLVHEDGTEATFTETFEFAPHHAYFTQSRPIARRLNEDTGMVDELVPSPWTYMTIHGFLKPDPDRTEALAPGLTVD